MKVFISFDMEGVAGIVDWSQCRGPGPAYEEGRRLLLGEVNAAIDGAMAAEADPFLPDAERVVVKESLTRFGAVNLHPEVARTMIADGARRAVERAGVLRPPAIARPATMEVQMQTADMAEVASWVRGAERTGVRAVSIRGDDPLAMFRSFVAVTSITRVAEGR
jgi:D-amino peptidase